MLSPLWGDLQGLSCTVADRDVGGGCRKIGQVRTAFGEAYDALKKYPFSATNGNNILGSILGVSNKVNRCSSRCRIKTRSVDLAPPT